MLVSFIQKLFFSTCMYLGLVFYSFHSHYSVTDVLYINEPPKEDLFKLSIYFLLFIIFLSVGSFLCICSWAILGKGMEQLQEDYL